MAPWSLPGNDYETRRRLWYQKLQRRHAGGETRNHAQLSQSEKSTPYHGHVATLSERYNFDGSKGKQRPTLRIRTLSATV